jgi:hypothetical protein
MNEAGLRFLTFANLNQPDLILMQRERRGRSAA